MIREFVLVREFMDTSVSAGAGFKVMVNALAFVMHGDFFSYQPGCVDRQWQG